MWATTRAQAVSTSCSGAPQMPGSKITREVRIIGRTARVFPCLPTVRPMGHFNILGDLGKTGDTNEGSASQKGTSGMATMPSYDVIIIGGGIAGCALATTLARSGLAVGVLERDPEPVDRVRGEFMAPWGVIELKRLGLLDTLMNGGGVFSVRNIPYDENQPGEQAIPFTVRYADLVPDVAGAFCMALPEGVDVSKAC